MNYAMNMPMNWDTFKSMPLDLQQTYLDGLNSRFNVGSATISKELFNMSTGLLRAHTAAHGLKDPKGRKLGGKNRELWENWLEGDKADRVELDPLEEPKPIEEEETPVEEEAPEEEKPTEPFFSPGGIGHHLFPFMPLPNKYDTIKESKQKEDEPLGLDHLSATFKGVFSPETFLQWITKLPMPDGNVYIRVEVDRR